MPDYSEFKVVYHLMGGEVLPIFISAIQFPKDCIHYLLVTGYNPGRGDTDEDNVVATLGRRGIRAEIRNLGPREIGWEGAIPKSG